MHSGVLIFIGGSLILMLIYLAEIHRVIGYTHVRQYQRSIRGMRFLLMINITLIAIVLFRRHVELISLGWW